MVVNSSTLRCFHTSGDIQRAQQATLCCEVWPAKPHCRGNPLARALPEPGELVMMASVAVDLQLVASMVLSVIRAVSYSPLQLAQALQQDVLSVSSKPP